MSVIDRFVVQLGLDARGFSDEAKQSVEQMRKIEQQAGKTGAGFEGTGKKGADAFSAVRREALAMFAVFTGGKGLKDLTTQSAQANANVTNLAKGLAMAPSTLYRLEHAAKAAGGSLGEIASSFGALQSKLSDGRNWKDISSAFNNLGVANFLDKNGHLRPDIPKLLNEGIHRLNLDPAVASSQLEALGLGQGVKNMALMDPGDFRKFWSEQQRMVTPSDKELRTLNELQQSIINLKTQTEGLSDKFVSDLAPSIKKVLDQLTKWEQGHPDAAKTIAAITVAVNELTGAFGGLFGVLAAGAGVGIIKRLFGGDTKKILAALEELKATQKAGAATQATQAAKSGIKMVPPPNPGSAYPRLGWLARSLPEIGAGESALAGATSNPYVLAALATGIVMRPKSTNEGEALAIAIHRAGEVRRKIGGSHGRDWLPSNQEFFNTFAEAISARESGGDYNKTGGDNGHFYGKYQMGKAAIADAAEWIGEQTPSIDEFLADPARQERFFRAFTDRNSAWLASHDDVFAQMDERERFMSLAYAHAQGAGGATSWHKTGISRQDAFGTDGAVYADDIRKAWAQERPAPEPDTAQGGGGQAATALRYNAAQARQISTLKNLVDAHNDSIAQSLKSIIDNPAARAMRDADAGTSPGAGSRHTSTTNASFNGDVIIHTNATNAQEMARDAAPQLRRAITNGKSQGLQ